MAFPRIAELLDTNDRTPKETNELTELIIQQASSDAISSTDTLKEILLTEIRATNERIDGSNERIDALKEILLTEIRATNERVDGSNERIDALKEILLTEIRATNERVDGTNQRMDIMDKRMDIMDKRMDKMDQRMSGIQTSIRWLIGLMASTAIGVAGILVRMWLNNPI